MIEATIVLMHSSGRKARAVAASVSPDNPKTEPRITTRVRGRQTEMTIQEIRSTESLVVTLNDLLSCVQAAEKTLTSML